MLKSLIILLVATVLGWGLTSFDAKVTGEDKSADFRRRAWRTGASTFLVFVASLNVLFWIGAALPLGILWASCLSELFTRGFQTLVDPRDKREFDPNKINRDLDQLAQFIREGRHDEAFQLCKVLEESPECSAMAIETLLFRLYGELYSDEQLRANPSLAEIHLLREQNQFAEAESRLNALRKGAPDDLNIALMLLRVCAEDLKRPSEASLLLDEIGKRPVTPPRFVEYARHCVNQWSGAVPRVEKTSEGIESLLVPQPHAKPAEQAPQLDGASVDELLAAGHLATAIEHLEKQMAGRPGDFDLLMKLAEAHGVYCRDLRKAGKIVEKIEANVAFTPDQVRSAKARLGQWRKAA